MDWPKRGVRECSDGFSGGSLGQYVMRAPKTYTSAFVLAAQAEHAFRTLTMKDKRAAEQVIVKLQTILREPVRQQGNVG